MQGISVCWFYILQLYYIHWLALHTKETRIERDTCTPMFIAAMFIIARTWKQPWCPSADEWIRKLWYIYTMEYINSAIKKNTFESVLMRWMRLEPIIQIEVSQKEKHQYSIKRIYMEFRKIVTITLYARQQKRQLYRTIFWALWERARVGWFGRMALKHV